MKNKKVCYCNVCGKELNFEHGILKEGVFNADIKWGFFSKKDLQIHRFSICEDCYDTITQSFVIPVKVQKKVEIL